MASKDNKKEKYNKIRLLSKGSYGKAYLVEAESDGSLAVIKTCEFSERDPTNLKEAFMLREMNHPNIIQFKDFYLTKSK